MKVQHRFDVEIDLHCIYLEGDPLEPVALVEEESISDDLIRQQGRGPVQDGDLHLSIGKVIQGDHQLQLSFH